MKRLNELVVHVLGGDFDREDVKGSLIYLGAELAALIVLMVVTGVIGTVISLLI